MIGDDIHTSSEWGDRDNLDLPGDQMALLEAVVATGTPTVVILITGRTATFGCVCLLGVSSFSYTCREVHCTGRHACFHALDTHPKRKHVQAKQYLCERICYLHFFFSQLLLTLHLHVDLAVLIFRFFLHGCTEITSS